MLARAWNSGLASGAGPDPAFGRCACQGWLFSNCRIRWQILAGTHTCAIFRRYRQHRADQRVQSTLHLQAGARCSAGMIELPPHAGPRPALSRACALADGATLDKQIWDHRHAYISIFLDTLGTQELVGRKLLHHGPGPGRIH